MDFLLAAKIFALQASWFVAMVHEATLKPTHPIVDTENFCLFLKIGIFNE